MSTPNRDDDHLRLLSIFHYILGGVTAAMSCFALLYVFVGVGLIAASGAQGSALAWTGVLVFVLGAIGVAIGLAIGALMIWAGYGLAHRRHYTLCIVVAALSCLSFPLGTALGVFTLIVLLRPSVKESFGLPQPAAPSA